MITKGFFAYVRFPKTEVLYVATVLGIGLPLGHYLDTSEAERQTLFRDKSALFKRDPPPEKPSWP